MNNSLQPPVLLLLLLLLLILAHVQHCRLTNTQFSKQELRAIVEEAEACGTYVCAHAYTSAAIARCASTHSNLHGQALTLTEHGSLMANAADAWSVE